MKCIALTNEGRFELRRPQTETEWNCYHSIRERSMWDAETVRQLGAYDRNHPVQYGDDYTVLVLLRNGIIIGVMGMQDMGEHDHGNGRGREVEFRAIGIEPACQGQGYGRVMMMMAESTASHAGYGRAGLWSQPATVPFYARNGFVHRPDDMPARLESPLAGGIAMTKRLDLGVAQNDGSVLIAAA